MSYLSELEKISKIQDKLKDNKERADDNLLVAGFVKQMKPTKENIKNEKEAKNLYKDIDNALNDLKDTKKDIKRGQRGGKDSRKLAKRFEGFLKSGQLDRAENLLGYIDSKQGVDISPYLSKNFGKMAGKSGIDLKMNFDMPQEQLIAQAPYPAPLENKNFSDIQSVEGIIKDGLEGFPRVREMVDFFNEKEQWKKDFMDDVLNRGNKKDQSAAFGDLLAGGSFNNFSTPTVDPSSLAGINFDFSYA